MWRKKMILTLLGLLCCLTWSYGQAQGAAKVAPKGEGRGKGSGQWRMDAWGRGEEVVQLLEKLQKENPAEYKRLNDLRQNEPEQFYREIRNMLPRRDEWSGKINQAEQKCRELAEKYKKAKNEDEKKLLLTELDKALKESFDLVINDALSRIERLQNRVQEMQQNEEKILAERQKIFLSNEQGKMPPPRPKR